MEPSTKKWELASVESQADFKPRELLPALAKNEIAAIRIANFYSKDELETITENINKQGVLWYPKFENKQGRIGICATEYYAKLNGKAAYFALEPEATRVRNSIFPSNVDHSKRLISLFSKDYDTAVATEPELNNAPYFVGLIRAMNTKSTLHFDYAPFEMPEWAAGDADVQFALVTYLQMPTSGGGLTMYNKSWDETVPFNKEARSKGYIDVDLKEVEGVESITATPQAGDVCIINSRNLHQVVDMDSTQSRFACVTFAAFKNDRIRLWS